MQTLDAERIDAVVKELEKQIENESARILSEEPINNIYPVYVASKIFPERVTISDKEIVFYLKNSFQENEIEFLRPSVVSVTYAERSCFVNIPEAHIFASSINNSSRFDYKQSLSGAVRKIKQKAIEINEKDNIYAREKQFLEKVIKIKN